MTELLDMDAAAEQMAEYIRSRDWWIFFILNLHGLHVIETIENEFFPPGTEANGDLEMLIAPGTTVACARKSRLSVEALRKILHDAGAEEGVWVDDNRDILWLFQEPE